MQAALLLHDVPPYPIPATVNVVAPVTAVLPNEEYTEMLGALKLTI
jgi:hypothetical protein